MDTYILIYHCKVMTIKDSETIANWDYDEDAAAQDHC